MEFTEEPPFDPAIHIRTPVPNEEQKEKIAQFRVQVEKTPNAVEHAAWLTDLVLQRFLIARNYDIEASTKLMNTALEWRTKRKPHLFDRKPGWNEYFGKESETGKIYCPGFDRWGRSVLIFDNTVQNTPHVDDHMNFLAWNLEFAIKLMAPNRDKYCVFMHLENFSFFNIPPFASTRETILMLCNTFPEHLGHCIAYKPPYIFKAFYDSVKGFFDPKTASKVVFIYGDVSDGSENDLLLKRLIGDNWKVLTGAEQEVLAPNTSPGYNHSKFWPTVQERYDAFRLPHWRDGEIVYESEANAEEEAEGEKRAAESVPDETETPTETVTEVETPATAAEDAETKEE